MKIENLGHIFMIHWNNRFLYEVQEGIYTSMWLLYMKYLFHFFLKGDRELIGFIKQHQLWLAAKKTVSE